LCRVHAERLVHKLVLSHDKQRNAVEVAKRMIRWFYRCLKDYKLAPSPERAEVLRSRFDRIFERGRTGYATLDRLLRRLLRHKDELLRVLERPEIPLNSRRLRSNRPDQRLGKRHPRLRHQKKNLRRNRQRQRPRRPRRHARSGENLHEIEIVVLRLHRRPVGNPRPQNPGPRNPRQARPRLNQVKLAREFAPVT